MCGSTLVRLAETHRASGGKDDEGPRHSFAIASDLFLRLRFTEPKWRSSGEFVILPTAASRYSAIVESQITGAPDQVRLSPLLQAPARQVLEAVGKLGLEGVVGKRIDSTYGPGERSGEWIKLRRNIEQDFVIGGYVPGARGLVHCWWAPTKRKTSSSSRRFARLEFPHERPAPLLGKRKQCIFGPMKFLAVKHPGHEGNRSNRGSSRALYWNRELGNF